jgi:hypothetical protein
MMLSSRDRRAVLLVASLLFAARKRDRNQSPRPSRKRRRSNSNRTWSGPTARNILHLPVLYHFSLPVTVSDAAGTTGHFSLPAVAA